jgi:diketogulonate reductase-like aldo/keto reductase
VLAWAVQRCTAFLTTSSTRRDIQENFEVSALPEDAMQEIRDGITPEPLDQPAEGNALICCSTPKTAVALAL